MAQRLLGTLVSRLHGLRTWQQASATELTMSPTTAQAPALLTGLWRWPLPSLTDAASFAPAQAAAPTICRGFAANPAAKAGAPQFTGRKMRTYTSYRERFRLTATGKVRYNKPGHRHKRWVKGPKRNRNLRGENIMHDAYVRVMRKMGFS